MSQPTPEQLLAESQKLSDASSIQPPQNQIDFKSRMAESLEKMDEAQASVQTGESLDFDIDSFIKEGIISKKNIPLMKDKLYVDMQTLTQKQRMFCEQMVRNKWGTMPSDNVYSTAIEAAILAMSITRMNNQQFPMPDMTDKSAANKALEGRKVELFEKFLDSSSEFIRGLSLLYTNLALADLLSEQDKKKS